MFSQMSVCPQGVMYPLVRSLVLRGTPSPVTGPSQEGAPGYLPGLDSGTTPTSRGLYASCGHAGGLPCLR